MQIRVLGPVDIEVDGQSLQLGGPKQRAVLALLALNANATVSVDRLIEGLWGEDQPATAPKMVQLYVSQLRKLVGENGAEIVTHGRGYELRIDPDMVDAARFERLVAEASSAQGNGGSRRSRASGARALARSPARGPARRAVRARRGSAARGAASRGRRAVDRERSRGGSSSGADRPARGARRRASAERAPPRAADARPLPLPAGRRTRSMPIARRAQRSSRRWESSPVRSCAGCTRRSCARTRSSSSRCRTARGRAGRRPSASTQAQGERQPGGVSCARSSRSSPLTSPISTFCARARQRRRGTPEEDGAMPVCPFKGLAPFEAADAEYYFGRERLVAEIVARLVGTPAARRDRAVRERQVVGGARRPAARPDRRSPARQRALAVRR